MSINIDSVVILILILINNNAQIKFKMNEMESSQRHDRGILLLILLSVISL